MYLIFLAVMVIDVSQRPRIVMINIEVLEVEVYTGVLFASYDPVSPKIAVTWTEVCLQTWCLQL